MKNIFLFSLIIILTGCNNVESPESIKASELEQSLFDYIIDACYPACIDTVYGGYISTLDYRWKATNERQEKALVQQTRHIWTLAFLYEHYPERNDFLNYARHGFDFFEEHFWDKEFGGFYDATTREGLPYPSSINTKRIYGQAFAINGLAQYYKVSEDKDALDMAIKSFMWMEEKVHVDGEIGYLECLNRDGSPELPYPDADKKPKQSPLLGLKEFNSSLHILEAFTELYKVWPDELLRKRLEEMYLLFRDTIIHPDGYLLLYFYPDWTLVPNEVLIPNSAGSVWNTQHVTFGHDVETAFLMTEAAEALGIEEDHKMQQLTKKLVDHSLRNGWDEENGGFYYIALKQDGKTIIHDDHKAFWVESEGLNAIMLMHTLYPEDEMNYFDYFLKMWNYIDTYLIDKEYGGWYNYGLDTAPENKKQNKSHNWKATYHDVRGMVRTIEMLRKEATELQR